MARRFGFYARSRPLTKFFSSFGEKLDKGMYCIASIIGTIAMGLGGAFAGSFDLVNKCSNAPTLTDSMQAACVWPVFSLSIGAGFLLWGGKGVFNDQYDLAAENKYLKEQNTELPNLRKKIESTEEDCETLRSKVTEAQQKSVRTWLKGVAKQINLCPDSRVTIYYERDDAFYLLARWSTNPLRKRIHKITFGLNQGVISKTWQRGKHLELNSPEFKKDPDAYYSYMEKNYGYRRAELEHIGMKSCRYVAFAITEADRNIGVILFESIIPTAFSEDNIKKISSYCDSYQSHLTSFVHDALVYNKPTDVSNRSSNDDLNIIEEFMRGDNG